MARMVATLRGAHLAKRGEESAMHTSRAPLKTLSRKALSTIMPSMSGCGHWKGSAKGWKGTKLTSTMNGQPSSTVHTPM